MAKRITSLTALTTPKNTMEMLLQDADDTFDKKITYANLINQFLPLSGAGAPSSTPDFVGQRYIDTTGNREYYAVGTGGSGDWRKVAVYRYETITITAGGGDVVVNWDVDWTDGVLTVIRSDAAVSYFSGTQTSSELRTTYDALTNGSYTADHVLTHRDSAAGNYHDAQIKTTNASGFPKSAAPTSVTLDDDGATTVYAKLTMTA